MELLLDLSIPSASLFHGMKQMVEIYIKLAELERKHEDTNRKITLPREIRSVRQLKLKNEDPNKEPPNLTQIFERTRKRTEGNIYVDTYDDTAKKIEQMKNYKPPEDGSVSVNPFLAVMSKEYDGHRRLFGRGVTNKLIKKVNGGETSYMVSVELMESLNASVEAEKSQLVDMRRELEKDHERKKAELEVMRKDIDNQRDKLVEDTVQKFIEKLPSGVAREFLT